MKKADEELVEFVSRNGLCVGCGLCASIAGPAIKISISPEGFARPCMATPLEPFHERLIEKTCPGLVIEHPHRDDSSKAGGSLWGPLIAVRIGYASDRGLRYLGSSGGALSAMLAFLLDIREVDFVLQVGASSNTPIGNENRVSRSISDIADCAGSRYAPSSPLADIANYLDDDVRIAFVGKPCDVAALRAYARQDDRVDRRVRYMFSFMCAGIPSFEASREILHELGTTENEVVAFRYRGEGWPGTAKAQLRDGSERRMTYHESWGRILGRQLQFRCKICPDSTGEFADVVCADAWHLDESGIPTFEEADGRSIILSRTDRGEDLVRRCAAAGSLVMDFLDSREIEKMQPHQAERKRMVAARIAALQALRLPTPRYRRLGLLRAATRGGLVRNARNFLGMLRRARLPGLRT